METIPPQEEIPLSLREFLSHENPNSEEYQKLIKDVAEGQGHFTPDDFEVKTNFDVKWQMTLQHEKGKELLDYLKSKLGGDILIDLGGSWGSLRSGMGKVAKMTGAKTFITVDKYLKSNLPIDPYTNISEKKKEDSADPEMVIVQADLLDFVSRLPDNSVNITINGIDGLIIPNSDYHKALAKEIIRVAKDGGVVFGINADSLEWGENDPAIVKKDFRSAIPQATILEKKDES